MADRPQFGEALRELRESRGLTQAQLARDLGEYEGNISRWQRGKGIDIDNVRKIADYFGVERSWLEALAGYSDSDRTFTKDTEAERQQWRSRYDYLMEKKVPRWAWNAYMEACAALAEAYERMQPPSLSTDAEASLSSTTAENEGQDPDGQNGQLSPYWQFQAATEQNAKRRRALVPAGF